MKLRSLVKSAGGDALVGWFIWKNMVAGLQIGLLLFSFTKIAVCSFS